MVKNNDSNTFISSINDLIKTTAHLSHDIIMEIINSANQNDIEQMPPVILEYVPSEEFDVISCELGVASRSIPLSNLDITSTLSEQMSSILMASNDYTSVGNSSFCNTAELSVGCFNQIVFMDPMS